MGRTFNVEQEFERIGLRGPTDRRPLARRVESEALRLGCSHGPHIGDTVLCVVSQNGPLVQRWLAQARLEFGPIVAQTAQRFGMGEEGLVWPLNRACMYNAMRDTAPELASALALELGPYSTRLIVHWMDADGVEENCAVAPYILSLTVAQDADAPSCAEPKCPAPVALHCTCLRCGMAAVGATKARFHTCYLHHRSTSAQHLGVRGRGAEWALMPLVVPSRVA